MILHSCWSILFFCVLFLFLFYLFVHKIIFGKCLGKRKQKKRKRKRGNSLEPGRSPANPPAPPPPPACLRGPPGARPTCAPSLPLCVDDERAPRVSAFLFFSSAPPSRGQWKLRFDSVEPRFSCHFHQPSPFKAPRDAPRRVFAPKSRNRALAAVFYEFWISPNTFTATRPLCLSSVRDNPLGELATCSSTSSCSWFLFWCSETRYRRAPASSVASAMVSAVEASPPAGRIPPRVLPAVQISINAQD